MKLNVYINNEDGTFTKDNYEAEVDAYNRPYKGDSHDDKYSIYDIEIKDDVMVCYVCKKGSDLLDGIEYLKIEILDHPYLKTRHIPPEKYMEGKICKLENGTFFTIGKILQRYNVKDEDKLFPYLTDGGAAACVI